MCIALLFLCLAGCGDKRVSVSGMVRLDGKPVAAAGVTLHPVGSGPLASGMTDAEGRYQLETGNRPGVVPGEYRATVAKKAAAGFLADKNGLSSGIVTAEAKEEWIVPRKYAGPDTSGLTVSIKYGMAPLDFDLKSQ
jgi:hypothetical protein